MAKNNIMKITRKQLRQLIKEECEQHITDNWEEVSLYGNIKRSELGPDGYEYLIELEDGGRNKLVKLCWASNEKSKPALDLSKLIKELWPEGS
jgi:hypothetical protein